MSKLQKWQPFTKKCVENATPRAENASPDSHQLTGRRSCSVFSELLKLGRKELGTSRPYPPVAHKLECAYFCPCLILTLHLPGDLLFARPKGALRLSARLIPNRKRRAFGAIVLSRISYLIPNRRQYPETMILWGAYFWPCFTLPLPLPGALLFVRPKGALRLSARPIGGGC